MPKYKLAMKSTSEGCDFVYGQLDAVDESLHPGIKVALSLALPTVPARSISHAPPTDMTTEDDVQQWVSRILDRAAVAPESELLGLAEALDGLLSWEERSSEDLIDERRSAGRLARAFRRVRRRRHSNGPGSREGA
jgi:hypothetical protein